MSNAVNHPPHYAEGRKYEPIKVISDWGLNFNLGSALKYIARAGRKGDPVEDLQKAIEYLKFEIADIEAEREKEIERRKSADRNCKHTVKPVVAENGVIVIEAPANMGPEEIIKSAIRKIYGGE